MENNYQTESIPNGNNKRKWVMWVKIILIVVTVICIIVGVTRFFGFGIAGYRNVVNKTVDTEPFTSLNIDASMANLSFVYGNSYRIEYQYPEKAAPAIDLKDGTMNIMQKTKGSLMGLKSIKCDLIITVPEGTDFDRLSFKVDMGALELDGLKAKTAEIDADMGDINIKNCDFGTMIMEADMGSIKLNRVTWGNGSLDADLGSIEGKALSCNEISCNADMGSIDLEGDFDAITAKCSMGAINIVTGKSESDVRLDLKADLGNIKFNGEGKGRSFQN